MNHATWIYDPGAPGNRVIQETNELDHSRYFQYDALGNRTQQVDRRQRFFRHSPKDFRPAPIVAPAHRLPPRHAQILL